MNQESGIRNYAKWRRLLFVVSMSLILNSLFLIPKIVHAQISPGLGGDISGTAHDAAIMGLGNQAASDIDIRLYVLRIIKAALGYLGLVLVIMIIYGGVLYLISGGNEEKIEKGKAIITRAVIGTAIILSSYAITKFIDRQLTLAINSQMITQAQSCGVTGGQSTCCSEWNSYQTELGATVPLAPIGGGSGATGLDAQTAQRQRVAYNRWHDCFTRATQRAGLPSNLFN